jgi:MerR family regulatory protein
MSEMSIGELAKDTGVNVQTVRYYERRGLLACSRIFMMFYLRTASLVGATFWNTRLRWSRPGCNGPGCRS